MSGQTAQSELDREAESPLACRRSPVAVGPRAKCLWLLIGLSLATADLAAEPEKSGPREQPSTVAKNPAVPVDKGTNAASGKSAPSANKNKNAAGSGRGTAMVRAGAQRDAGGNDASPRKLNPDNVKCQKIAGSGLADCPKDPTPNR